MRGHGFICLDRTLSHEGTASKLDILVNGAVYAVDGGSGAA